MTFYRFSPDMMDSELLKQLSVGRKKMLSDIMKRIREHAIKKIPFHLIFIGPRGIGKTHLLLLIHYGIRDTDLSELVRSIKLSEEEYSVVRLSDLLYRILDEAGLGDIEKDKELIIQQATDYLNQIEKEKMIVLLIDNLHLLFEQLPEEDLNRLRSILQEQKNLMIIGAAPSVFGELTNYKHPFYNFFEIQFLKELTRSEIKAFIKKKLELEKEEAILSRFDEYSKKVEAISILTGGNPRLIITLCEILCKPDKLIEIEEALLTLLDGLTPYYQSKMETLPTQQRKIFDTLAISEGPLTPTEIAKLTEYPVNVVNVQLKRLQDLGYVETVRYRKKKTIKYEVRERLFRIWREMRFPLGRRRISLFVKFLELWFSKEELIEQYSRMLNEIEKTKQDIFTANRLADHLWYIQEAIGSPTKYDLQSMRIARLLSSDNLSLAKKEIDALKEMGKSDETARALYYVFESIFYGFKGYIEKSLKSARNAFNLRPEDTLVIVTVASSLFLNKTYAEAIEYCDLLIDTKEKKDKAFGYFLKSMNLMNLNNLDESLVYVDKSLKLDDNFAPAWNLKGMIFKLLKNPEAITCHNKAITLKPKNSVYVCERAKSAYVLGDKRAEEWVDQCLSVNPDHLYVNINKSQFLLKKRQFTQAELFIKKALQLVKKKRGLIEEKFFNDLFSIYVIVVGYGSVQSLDDGKLEEAKKHVSSFLQLRKMTTIEVFREEMFEYFLFLCSKKKFQFIFEAFRLAENALGKEDTQIIISIVKAAEYITTNNVDILERLQKEERAIVIEIVEKFSPKTPIPKNLKI